MKAEFNGENFSANINSEFFLDKHQKNTLLETLWDTHRTIFLGIIAIFISLINLSYALFINIGIDFLREFYESKVGFWTTILFVFSIVMIVISLTCAVLSIISFAKREKSSFEVVGLIFSILSFAISTVCIILNILSLVIS